MALNRKKWDVQMDLSFEAVARNSPEGSKSSDKMDSCSSVNDTQHSQLCRVSHLVANQLHDGRLKGTRSLTLPYHSQAATM